MDWNGFLFAFLWLDLFSPSFAVFMPFFGERTSLSMLYCTRYQRNQINAMFFVCIWVLYDLCSIHFVIGGVIFGKGSAIAWQNNRLKQGYKISEVKSSFHLKTIFVLFRISFGTSSMKYKSEALKWGISRKSSKRRALKRGDNYWFEATSSIVCNSKGQNTFVQVCFTKYGHPLGDPYDNRRLLVQIKQL